MEVSREAYVQFVRGSNERLHRCAYHVTNYDLVPSQSNPFCMTIFRIYGCVIKCCEEAGVPSILLDE